MSFDTIDRASPQMINQRRDIASQGSEVGCEGIKVGA
jgi:hypothetical protein